MRRRGSLVAFALVAMLGGAATLGAPACGGTVATVGDGGASGDATSADAIVTNDATPQTDAPVPVDCNALRAKVDALRTEAKTCCPFCNSQQCGFAVMDVCCPISITASSAPAFSAAVAEYEKQCPQACPATPCAKAPSFNCKPNDPMNPSSRGTCQ